MSQSPFSGPHELRRHLLAHVESLRAAGVELLPRGPAVEVSFSGAGVDDLELENVSAAGNSEGLRPAARQEATSGDTVEQRRQALQVLAGEVKGCVRCPELASTRTQTVFADGPAHAELCFIGEAPGGDEDAQGLPFVGAAGQLLNRILVGCGFRREEVYICNIIKCRPPGNRTPLPSESANCRGFLERQLELVRPKFIVALGGCAATNLLQTTLSLGKLRGRFHDWHGIPVMVTYHPAYLLPHRSPEKKKEVWEDMKMLLAKMGREIPKRT
jgi:uracil-DNA glycosylase family 4